MRGGMVGSLSFGVYMRAEWRKSLCRVCKLEIGRVGIRGGYVVQENSRSQQRMVLFEEKRGLSGSIVFESALLVNRRIDEFGVGYERKKKMKSGRWSWMIKFP